MVEALKYSPVGVCVFGWKERGGVYVRDGEYCNHWCLLLAVDDLGSNWVLDSYAPYIKKLDRGYIFAFAKGYSVNLRG